MKKEQTFAEPLTLESIGPLLKSLRKQQGFTQLQVAKRIGKTRSYISMIESGKSDPMFYVILNYCSAIDVVPKIILEKIK